MSAPPLRRVRLPTASAASSALDAGVKEAKEKKERDRASGRKRKERHDGADIDDDSSDDNFIPDDSDATETDPDNSDESDRDNDDSDEYEDDEPAPKNRKMNSGKKRTLRNEKNAKQKQAILKGTKHAAAAAAAAAALISPAAASASGLPTGLPQQQIQQAQEEQRQQEQSVILSSKKRQRQCFSPATNPFLNLRVLEDKEHSAKALQMQTIIQNLRSIPISAGSADHKAKLLSIIAANFSATVSGIDGKCVVSSFSIYLLGALRYFEFWKPSQQAFDRFNDRCRQISINAAAPEFLNFLFNSGQLDAQGLLSTHFRLGKHLAVHVIKSLLLYEGIITTDELKNDQKKEFFCVKTLTAVMTCLFAFFTRETNMGISRKVTVAGQLNGDHSIFLRKIMLNAQHHYYGVGLTDAVEQILNNPVNAHIINVDSEIPRKWLEYHRQKIVLDGTGLMAMNSRTSRREKKSPARKRSHSFESEPTIKAGSKYNNHNNKTVTTAALATGTTPAQFSGHAAGYNLYGGGYYQYPQYAYGQTYAQPSYGSLSYNGYPVSTPVHPYQYVLQGQQQQQQQHSSQQAPLTQPSIMGTSLNAMLPHDGSLHSTNAESSSYKASNDNTAAVKASEYSLHGVSKHIPESNYHTLQCCSDVLVSEQGIEIRMIVLLPSYIQDIAAERQTEFICKSDPLNPMLYKFRVNINVPGTFTDDLSAKDIASRILDEGGDKDDLKGEKEAKEKKEKNGTVQADESSSVNGILRSEMNTLNQLTKLLNRNLDQSQVRSSVSTMKSHMFRMEVVHQLDMSAHEICPESEDKPNGFVYRAGLWADVFIAHAAFRKIQNHGSPPSAPPSKLLESVDELATYFSKYEEIKSARNLFTRSALSDFVHNVNSVKQGKPELIRDSIFDGSKSFVRDFSLLSATEQAGTSSSGSLSSCPAGTGTSSSSLSLSFTHNNAHDLGRHSDEVNATSS